MTSRQSPENVRPSRTGLRPGEWLLGGLLTLTFVPALLAMAGVWSSVDYYSHGFLVPIVSFWGANRTGRLIREPRDLRGIAAAAAALALYALGLGIGSVTVQGMSLIVAVAACVLYLGSTRALRAQRFSLLFLVFMVPLPPDWLAPIIVGLQVIVSTTAVGMLVSFGSQVAQQGNVIVLPGGGSLFVAEACSGITSIVTLLPLGVMLAYFTERTWVRRVALVAAVVPVAMAGNLLRVVVTVLAAERYGAERATGNILHDWAGVITFALATLALIALGELIRRMPAANR